MTKAFSPARDPHEKVKAVFTVHGIRCTKKEEL